MVLCWKRPEIGIGSMTNGLPYAFACRYVTIASSPASNALSRSIALKASCASLGPQQSSFTTLDVTRPSFIAIVSALSARFVFKDATAADDMGLALQP